MSLTSCYNYIVELPVATLNETLHAALFASDSAGYITQHWENIPIDGYTATVTAKLANTVTNSSILTLTSVDLGLSIHLQMDLDVKINELPTLNKMSYQLNFDLPGVFFKDSGPAPKLFMNFPAVTPSTLNLVVTSGEIVLTPELVKHEAFLSSAQVKSMITDRLVMFASTLKIPVFTPQPPSDPSIIDLTKFVPTTVNQQALALQIVALTDGTVCDTPDVFSQTTGFSLAISLVEAARLIEPIISRNLGGRHVDGYDINLNNLNIALSAPGEHGQAYGHLWASGDFDVSVDCWPEPNVSFSGPIFLTPEMNSKGTLIFTAQAGNFTSSDACCAHLDPSQIAALISGTQTTPFILPGNFFGVGAQVLSVTSADILAAGIVVHGNFSVTTNSVLQINEILEVSI